MNASEQDKDASILSKHAIKNFAKGIIIIILILLAQSLFAQVGIGTTSPDASSALDISSTEAGILIPRMTQTDRDNITSPATGLLIYQTNNSPGFYFYNGTSWIALGVGDKNTLDEAYDQGGAGIGRTIIANDGAVRINGEDGFLVTGTFGSGNTINTEITGAGTRMFFNPNKSAFRAGTAFGNEWDNINVGEYSFASGYSSTASGLGSTAIGFSAVANGDYSTAMGVLTTASGNGSTAMGSLATASGNSSIAMGDFSIASGSSSIAMGESTSASGSSSIALGELTNASGSSSSAMGYNTRAPSYAETSIGYNNTNYTPNNTLGANNADRVFSIGNGTGSSSATRSNALTIYKSGLMNINDEYNMPLTAGSTNQIMAIDAAGQVEFVNASSVFTNTDNQTIDTFSFDNVTNELTLEIENDGLPAQTVDLTTLNQGNTLDQAYDQGGAGSGRTITADNGAIEINASNPFSSGFIVNNTSGGGGNPVGATITAQDGFTTSGDLIGVKAEAINLSGEATGIEASITYNDPFGLNLDMENYGIKSNITISNPASTSVVNYGIQATASGGNENWAAYFGDPSTPPATSPFQYDGNVYVKDNLEIDRGLIYRPNGGATNIGDILQYVNTTGNLEAVDPSTIFVDNDNQNLSTASLTGTTLNLGIDNGTGTSINLAVLQDGVGTDNQSIDAFSFNPSTNELTLEIEDDGIVAQTVDLSSLRSNTLDQSYDQGGNGNGRTINATDGAVVITGTDGFSVSGTHGFGAAISSGIQTKMFFNPRKSAFRAGRVDSNQWNDANVGDYSVAFGEDNTASGVVTSAFGRSNSAIGSLSFTAGFSNNAGGDGSMAFGNNTSASGDVSTTMGENTMARSYAEVVIGRYNTLYTASSTTNWDISDQVFSIGKGTSNTNRRNALTIYKSGLMNINDEYDMPLTDGGTNQIMATDGAGIVSFVDASSVFTDTDDQTLSLSGSTLSIVDGNSIDISSIDTDDQTLSLSGNILSIADGNSVNISSINTNTQNTLDEAYDEGGTGAGRIINVDNGAVVIQGNAGSATATTSAQLIITETQANDFSRIRLTNSVETDNIWTIGARTDNTASASRMNFNHTGVGDVFQLWGDGVVEVNGTMEINGETGIYGVPDTDLHVFHNNTAGSDGFKLQNQGANNNWWRMFTSNADGRLYLYSTLGGGSSRGNFNNNTGVYSATSDRRLKKDFKPLPFSWENFMNLKTLSYLYKSQDDNKRSLGLIAQDVKVIYPELVSYNKEDDVYHMNYSGFGVIAIKAIQELKEEVDSLKIDNAILKAKLDQLENLEARILALENNKETTQSIEVVSKEN